jgi:hypothetical protein
MILGFREFETLAAMFLGPSNSRTPKCRNLLLERTFQDFPRILTARHVSSLMNGPNAFAISQSRLLVSRLLLLDLSVSKLLDLCHLSSRMDGPDAFRDFGGCEVERLLPFCLSMPKSPKYVDLCHVAFQ